MSNTVFKVWNSARTVKRSVFASSFAELVQKGCAKLNIAEAFHIQIVDERDGTWIDDWEVAVEMRDKPLLILRHGEEWTPRAQSCENISSITSGTSTASNELPASASGSTDDIFNTYEPLLTCHKTSSSPTLELQRCHRQRSYEFPNSETSGIYMNVSQGDDGSSLSLEDQFPAKIEDIASYVDCNENEIMSTPNGNCGDDFVAFRHFLGRHLSEINVSHDVYQISRPLLPVPKVKMNNARAFLYEVIPYLTQQLKLRQLHVLQSESIANLVTSKKFHLGLSRKQISKKTPRTGGPEYDKVCLMNRVDCLTVLLNTVDILVAREILCSMIENDISTPLIVADIRQNAPRCLMSVVTGTCITYKVNGMELVNSLFEDPFKLIVATRTGKGKCGKSTILNQLFKQQRFFCSKQDSYHHRVSESFWLEGFVEFAVLTEETCKNTVWLKAIKKYYTNEPETLIVLANVHGESTKCRLVLDQLASSASCFLVFRMPNADQSTAAVGGVKTVTVEVDPVNHNENNAFHLNTLSLNSERFIDQLCMVLSYMANKCEVRLLNRAVTDGAELGQDFNFIVIPEAKSLTDFVKQNTCERTKLMLEAFTKLHHDKNTEEFSNPSNPVRKLLDLYLAAIRLPKQKVEMGTSFLEAKLHLLSTNESAAARHKLRCLEQKQTMATAHEAVSAENRQEIKRVDEDIKSARLEVLNRTLDLDTFMQVLSHVYMTCTDVIEAIHEYPRTTAKLLTARYHLELKVNGNEFNQVKWFHEVCTSVSEQLQKQQAVVVSAIGTKSSGKSILMNNLFGCRFRTYNSREAKCVFELAFHSSSKTRQCDDDVIIIAVDVDEGEVDNDERSENATDFLTDFATIISDIVIIVCNGQNCSELFKQVQAALLVRYYLNVRQKVMPRFVVVHLHPANSTTGDVDDCCSSFNVGLYSLLNVMEKVGIFLGADHVDMSSVRSAHLVERDCTYHIVGSQKDCNTSENSVKNSINGITTAVYRKIGRILSKGNMGAKFGEVITQISSCWERVRHIDDYPMISKNFTQLEQFFDRACSIDHLKLDITSTFNSDIAALSSWRPHKLIHDLMSPTNSLEKAAKDLSTGMKDLNCSKKLVRSLRKFHEKVGAEKIPEFCPFTFLSILQEETQFKMTNSGKFATMALREVAEQLIHEEITSYMRINKVNSHMFNEVCIMIDGILQRMQRLFITEDAISLLEVKMVEGIAACYSHIFDRFIPFYKKGVSWTEISTIVSRCDSKKKLLKALKDHRLQKRVFKQSDACLFEMDMVAKMRETVKDLISNCNIGTSDTVLIHAWAQQQLRLYAESRHMEISKNNRRIFHELTKIVTDSNSIATRWYNHCVNSDALNKICIANLVYAVKQGLLNSVAEKTLSWTNKSHSLRQKCFSKLASDIISGQRAQASQFFLNPETAVMEWYSEELQRCDSAFATGQEFDLATRFLDEIASVSKEIERVELSKNAVKVIKMYCTAHSRTTSEHVFTTSGSEADCNCLRNQLLYSLESETSALLSLPLTEDPLLCQRLNAACQEKCYWCGALCWGKTGHTLDGIKHYSVHQPVGMNKFVNPRTGTLLAHPCYQINDEWNVSMPKRNDEILISKGSVDEQVLQERLRRTEDWSFEPCNKTVSKLMQWIFSQVHGDIAATHSDLLPATEDDMKTHGCLDVDVDLLLLQMHWRRFQ